MPVVVDSPSVGCETRHVRTAKMKMIAMSKQPFVVACLTGLLIAQAGPAAAETVTIQPGSEGKDTYGYEQGGASLDTNFGGRTYLQASFASNWQFESFIEFDLSTIPLGGYVEKAELSLFNYSIGWANRGDCYVDVYGVMDSWLEGNGGTYADPGAYDPNTPITWNNRPPDDGISQKSLLFEGFSGYPSHPSVSKTPNEWREWDVTNLVSAWHDGTSPNHGMVLKVTSGAQIFPIFYSSDAGANYRPMLVVTHVPEPATLLLLLIGGLAVMIAGPCRRRAASAR